MTIHYKPEEWRSYRLNTVSASQRRRMERHLARCEPCLKHYLDAIGEEEAKAAEMLLSADFTHQTVKRVRKAHHRSSKALRRRILLQYAAAASITLALTAGGFFDAVARDIPVIMRSFETFSQALNRTAETKWSDKLAETASEGINRILFEKEE